MNVFLADVFTKHKSQKYFRSWKATFCISQSVIHSIQFYLFSLLKLCLHSLSPLIWNYQKRTYDTSIFLHFALAKIRMELTTTATALPWEISRAAIRNIGCHRGWICDNHWKRHWGGRPDWWKQTYQRCAQFRDVDAFKISCVFPLVLLRTLCLLNQYKSLYDFNHHISSLVAYENYLASSKIYQCEVIFISDKTWNIARKQSMTMKPRHISCFIIFDCRDLN